MAGTVLPSSATSGHQALRGRSQPDCHPIESITGLRKALDDFVSSGGAPAGSAVPAPVSILGEASPGVALAVSREDHVHAIPLATNLLPGITKLGPGGAMPYPETGTTIDDLQAQINAEAVARAEADTSLEDRKVNIGVGIDATRVLVGGNTTTADGDANLTWTAGSDVGEFTITGYLAPETSLGTLAAGRYVIRYQGGAVLWNDTPTTYAATRAAIIQSVGLQVWHDGSWQWFSGSPDEGATEAEAAALGAGKTYEFSIASPQEVKLRFQDGGAANNSGTVTVRVDGSGLLNVEGTVDANTLRADDMAGTGERVTVAQADGTLRDVDEITWDGTLGLLRITKASAQNGLEVWNSQASGVATWVAKAATGHAMVAEAYGSSTGGTYGGRSRNDSVAFLGASYLGSGTALKNVFYGSNQSDTTTVVSFLAAFTEEAYYTQPAGWTFRQAVQVTADAGTGTRLVAAASDGHHNANADLTVTGSGASTKLAVATRTVAVRYTHVQGSAATSWTITHNLGEFPSVTVVDSGGSVCMGDITYNSANQLTLSFGAAFSGTAYLN
jgi:hypothetical protein